MLHKIANAIVYRLSKWLLKNKTYNQGIIQELIGHPLILEALKDKYHILKRHFYLPIPEVEDLKYEAESKLIGIDMNDKGQLKLIENILNNYKEEFNQFPIHKTETHKPTDYHLINGGFMAIDGNVYYALVRYLKPRTIVEIGSGNSTLLIHHAIQKNIEQGHRKSNLICIEPYPPNYLKENLSFLTELKESKIQDVPFEFFEDLKEDDILFIDSTHALRSGGDVWYEYCEILPRLKSGVYVHIHDISLPKPYPRTYFENKLYWNEQYLLQAFLTYNTKFEIMWAGNYLLEKYKDLIINSFQPEYNLMREKYPFSEPSSLWMRVK
jgi:predicted O-methyltransferase YrrM